MLLQYDPEADAAYVYVEDSSRDEGVDHTENVSRGPNYTRGIDYDAEGRILGYEFLNVSRGVDLADLPHREALAAVFAKTAGIRVLETT